MHVLYQFTFEASQSADGHVYALINFCSTICNMQLNVLNVLHWFGLLHGCVDYLGNSRPCVWLCSLVRGLRLQEVPFAAIRHKLLPVSAGYATICQRSLVGGGELVHHCDSGVLEAFP